MRRGLLVQASLNRVALGFSENQSKGALASWRPKCLGYDFLNKMIQTCCFVLSLWARPREEPNFILKSPPPPSSSHPTGSYRECSLTYSRVTS